MRWMRNAWMVRKRLHVKGDVMCTVLLLLLFCLLLYVHQVLLSSGWDRTTWRLEIQGSTSSSRALLGAPTRTRSSIIKAQRVSSNSIDQQSPPCQPQEPKFISNVITNPNPQSELKSPVKPNQQTKGKLKAWRKNTAPTKATDPRPTLPLFDFEGYLREKDNRDFKLLIDQPGKCIVGKDKAAGARDGGSSTSPYMLIAVKSVAADFDKRQVVRRTWGKEGLFQNDVAVRTVFLLGVPRNRSALPLWDRLLAYESEAFKDILLWDFEDTFFNLTLKETNFLQWVNASCHNVRFIFKGDADVYVNIENILEMLQGKKHDEDLFIGDIIVHAKPIRRRSSKYYVPEFIYGASLYPSYAGGGGFVMSGYTARRLSAACQQVELFPIDDVFLGMCLQQIGVKPLRHDGFRTFGIPRPSAAPHLQTFDPCFYRDLMVVHSLNVPQIWLMWKLLHDPKLSCHSRRYGTPRPFRWRGRLGGDGGEEEEENAQTETDYSFKVFVKHY